MIENNYSSMEDRVETSLKALKSVESSAIASATGTHCDHEGSSVEGIVANVNLRHEDKGLPRFEDIDVWQAQQNNSKFVESTMKGLIPKGFRGVVNFNYGDIPASTEEKEGRKILSEHEEVNLLARAFYSGRL